MIGFSVYLPAGHQFSCRKSVVGYTSQVAFLLYKRSSLQTLQKLTKCTSEIQAKTCIDFWEEYQSKSSSHWQIFFPWPHLHLFRQKNWNCSYCPVLKRHVKFLQAAFCQLFLILTVPKPFLWDSVNLNVKAMRSHRLGGKKRKKTWKTIKRP